MATTISPGLGTQRHRWIAPKKKDKGDNDIKRTLMELYPSMKLSDIDQWSRLIDKKQLREHLRDLARDQ